jgi:hypothetical protein
MRGDIVEYGEIPCGRERKVVCWLAHFAEVYGASVGVPRISSKPRPRSASEALCRVFGVKHGWGRVV